MEKKYKTVPEGGMLRIIALKDFSDVKKGDKGGLIEKESNLSQYGDCWVYKTARVYGNARVLDNARIGGNAQVGGDTWVYGSTRIYGDAKISGTVKLWCWSCTTITTSIENNKDYIILGNNRGEFHIYSSKIENITNITATARDYIKNIQTIRQIYLTPNF